MKYFIDTEFHEYKKFLDTIELISIGIVREDGNSIYLISREFDIEKAFLNDWLRENVLRPIFAEVQHSIANGWLPARNIDLELVRGPFGIGPLTTAIDLVGLARNQIAHSIRDFVRGDENPQFYGYYADYDWVVFCWLFGRMIDLPKGFPMYCRDLKQMFDELVVDLGLDSKVIRNSPEYPKQQNEHNALDDARWNLELYKYLERLKADSNAFRAEAK